MKKRLLTIALAAMSLCAAAQTSYTIQRACHPDDAKHYDTDQLRSHFMMGKVMENDHINLTYSLYDRLIFGGVVPVAKTMTLETSSHHDIMKNFGEID